MHRPSDSLSLADDVGRFSPEQDLWRGVRPKPHSGTRSLVIERDCDEHLHKCVRVPILEHKTSVPKAKVLAVHCAVGVGGGVDTSMVGDKSVGGGDTSIVVTSTLGGGDNSPGGCHQA